MLRLHRPVLMIGLNPRHGDASSHIAIVYGPVLATQDTPLTLVAKAMTPLFR
jgi:hypothetical protein